MKNKMSDSTISRDVKSFSKETNNIYETICGIAIRADQISDKLQKEIKEKTEEITPTTNDIEENYENHERIELSKHYERLPKPVLTATEEYLNGELSFKK